MNQIEGLAGFTPRLHRCRGEVQGCREDGGATSREPECLCTNVEKVKAALWPASVKEGGGGAREDFCVRRVDAVWSRFDRKKNSAGVCLICEVFIANKKISTL